MNLGQVIVGIFLLGLAAGMLVLGCLQLLEKGYLLNNAYLWASKEERRRMDEEPERKRPHYRQSGFTFLFLSLGFLALAIYSLTGQVWPYIAFWGFMLLAALYAVISSIQIERRK